jgi:hypothetical protein
MSDVKYDHSETVRLLCETDWYRPGGSRFRPYEHLGHMLALDGQLRAACEELAAMPVMKDLLDRTRRDNTRLRELLWDMTAERDGLRGEAERLRVASEIVARDAEVTRPLQDGDVSCPSLNGIGSCVGCRWCQ